MKLQIALDTLVLDEAIVLLDEIIKYIDIIEVGTPFLLEAGNHPVRVLKERYPNVKVLADTKIMDAGEYEAEGAFKAGADIVTVLGVTNKETIVGAQKAAKRYQGEVMIDMVCVEALAERAVELDAMGVDYICCHTAFDVQATGKNPLVELATLKQTVKQAKVAVAGGVNITTLGEIIAKQPDVIVVGGAIANAKDRIAMAKMMKHQIEERL